MKYFLIVPLIIIFVFSVLIFISGCSSKSGGPAGLINSRLARCPTSPNCVCSEFKEDNTHYIEPLNILKIDAAVLRIIKKSIMEAGGVITIEKENYLAATFTSSLFRFVDDFEVRIDETQNKIYFRSASRVGHSDMGVNRKRTELIKSLISDKVEKNL